MAVSDQDDRAWMDPERLRDGVSTLFQRIGLSASASDIVAGALVDADLAGTPSHGVMLVSMYVQRMQAGSVSFANGGEIVHDADGMVVLDAGHSLGQLSSHQAMGLLKARAPGSGIAAVAVRNAFHFGAAGYWASQLAEAGLVGVAMSNTRPLMPATGGAQRVVGNNPLAVAMPSADDVPIVVDMAMSASAMGKIRLAASKGESIPGGWAADVRGEPTTDPARAIEGMLLPMAGPKGLGLAFMVDLFCGGLSSGAIGAEVQRLYGDAKTPYGCAHFFLAIDVEHFLPLDRFASRASEFAGVLRTSARAEGVERVFSPGERAWDNRRRYATACPVERATLRRLRELATRMGRNADDVFPIV